MGFFACNMLSHSNSIPTPTFEITTHHYPFHQTSFFRKPTNLSVSNFRFRPLLVATNVENTEKVEIGEEEKNSKFRWVEIGPHITETQKQAISKLPPKMTKRCKALMKQIICFSPGKTILSQLLAAWVRIMRPNRADWLTVLKELSCLDHPMSFEANSKDSFTVDRYVLLRLDLFKNPSFFYNAILTIAGARQKYSGRVHSPNAMVIHPHLSGLDHDAVKKLLLVPVLMVGQRVRHTVMAVML
ncbi:hypothetical protein CsSME_00012543 [Camellia sinensis var. sinensis]